MSDHRFSVKLVPVEDKPVVFDLLQPYLKELSELPDEEILPDENGLYQYHYLDAYWVEAERFPYYLLERDLTAGFALITFYDGAWRIAEFYVLPEFRKQGLAYDCAGQLLNRHQGDWYISYNKGNPAGSRLWNKLAETHAESGVIKETEEGNPSHYCLKFTVG